MFVPPPLLFLPFPPSGHHRSFISTRLEPVATSPCIGSGLELTRLVQAQRFPVPPRLLDFGACACSPLPPKRSSFCDLAFIPRQPRLREPDTPTTTISSTASGDLCFAFSSSPNLSDVFSSPPNTTRRASTHSRLSSRGSRSPTPSSAAEFTIYLLLTQSLPLGHSPSRFSSVRTRVEAGVDMLPKRHR